MVVDVDPATAESEVPCAMLVECDVVGAVGEEMLDVDDVVAVENDVVLCDPLLLAPPPR